MIKTTLLTTLHLCLYVIWISPRLRTPNLVYRLSSTKFFLCVSLTSTNVTPNAYIKFICTQQFCVFIWQWKNWCPTTVKTHNFMSWSYICLLFPTKKIHQTKFIKLKNHTTEHRIFKTLCFLITKSFWSKNCWIYLYILHSSSKYLLKDISDRLKAPYLNSVVHGYQLDISNRIAWIHLTFYTYSLCTKQFTVIHMHIIQFWDALA